MRRPVGSLNPQLLLCVVVQLHSVIDRARENLPRNDTSGVVSTPTYLVLGRLRLTSPYCCTRATSCTPDLGRTEVSKDAHPGQCRDRPGNGQYPRLGRRPWA